jgi:hypothetical protein
MSETILAELVANLRRSHDATGAALGRLEAAVAPAEPPPDTPPEPVPPTVPPEPTKPPEDIFDSTGKLIRKKQPLPAANEWRVSQTKDLIEVYRQRAGDGDHIVLAPGEYETLDMNRSFDPRRPLVIRSESEQPWSAVFTKALRFNARPLAAPGQDRVRRPERARQLRDQGQRRPPNDHPLLDRQP